ncbi:recombinase family protein [Chamaesiphon sp. OTE_8_metabat_110]|uniref:recombinase family protein n=1 Tax=Chamaesiphon sp. OTE_8_metabat_110 TaxID=2964696 RepID=UPI00286BFBB2|nr:recombinase family protein [Chamaesiphon sp. OTE_8_metabat_110]
MSTIAGDAGVSGKAIWIEGGTRSGKTDAIVAQFCQWLDERVVRSKHSERDAKILVLAGNDDSKRDLSDRLIAKTHGKYPISAKTPIGFIQEEVLLFYPLLIQKLRLPAYFPLRLRPETEQELATKLWQPALERLNWREIAPSEYRFVRRILDLLQLAAYSCTPLADLPAILIQGFGASENGEIYQCVESLASEWRDWCLDRGLLTYGIMTELYWRYLLPQPEYQRQLRDRYWVMLADDVDDYPAIGRQICEFLLDAGVWGAFSYNPDGMVRLGLSADPDYLLGLKARCQGAKADLDRQVIYLDSLPTNLLVDSHSSIDSIVSAVLNPGNVPSLPPSISTIETRTRGEMLKETAHAAIALISSGIAPGEIAIIAPGLDAISRATITDIFSQQQIPLASLNAQLPLNSDPGVRALLTLLALTYPNLGQLTSRDEVADLLVTLSPLHPPQNAIAAAIDPVRAGLLADYCYAPSLSQPRLLPYTNFPRWDRLGASATKAYDRILAWVERAQSQQPSPLNLLNDAIGYFFQQGSYLPSDAPKARVYQKLSALRELMETAQHYWQVSERTHSPAEYLASAHQITAQFILLLRQGTISANPYPTSPLQPQDRAVTLSNIFQYRASKRSHAYHFWLDVGSPLWAEGGAATLYGANLLLQDRMGKLWTELDTQASDERRLERILRDLLYRVNDRLYLCNSDLATNGQEQMGALLSLVHGVAIQLEPQRLETAARSAKSAYAD